MVFIQSRMSISHTTHLSHRHAHLCHIALQYYNVTEHAITCTRKFTNTLIVMPIILRRSYRDIRHQFNNHIVECDSLLLKWANCGKLRQMK